MQNLDLTVISLKIFYIITDKNVQEEKPNKNGTGTFQSIFITILSFYLKNTAGIILFKCSVYTVIKYSRYIAFTKNINIKFIQYNKTANSIFINYLFFLLRPNFFCNLKSILKYSTHG